MPYIALINDLINDKAKVHFCGKRYGKNEIELIEDREPDSKIRISGVPDNTIVINLDDFFPAPDQIFAGSRCECCRADYILISATGNDRQIVFIELKKEDDDNSHIKKQLLGAEAFSHYCVALLKLFWEKEFPLHKFQKHFVCFKYTNSEKRGTDCDAKVSANNTVQNMLKLEGSHTFQYNRLIARKPK